MYVGRSNSLQMEIIALISRDIPLTKRPFKDLADKLGIGERALLSRIKSFKANGLMRKFSASLNHRKIGFRYNAMVVWNVPESFTDKAGNIMASYEAVSHCYQRRKAPDWQYNLYSMIHGRTKEECFDVAKRISDAAGIKEYKILFSSQEFKKESMLYF